MLHIFPEYYSVSALRAEPEALFIFGDNCERYGKGGQAIIRSEPNAVGIATKLSPSAYMTDRDFLANLSIILHDLQPVNSALNQGKKVYWPRGGIGTGLSAMPEKCPATFSVLQFLMDILFEEHAAIKGQLSTWTDDAHIHGLEGSELG
jgi:hypothetical protein